MSPPSFAKHVEEDARLIILKELGSQMNGSLSETIIVHVLEAFGHTKSRDWIRTQLSKMQEVGAITIREVGSVWIAKLTQAGEDHILLRSRIEGIKQPSRGA